MEEIKKYVEENKERFLNELFELIRIPSISSLSWYAKDPMESVRIAKEFFGGEA